MSQDILLLLEMNSFNVNDIEAHERKNVQKGLTAFGHDYLNKFVGGEIFPPIHILRLLSLTRKKLPRNAVNAEDEAKAFYADIHGWIKDNLNCYTLVKPGLFLLQKDDMEDLARALRMKKTDLIQKMSQYHFLRLQPSSGGFQCKVRMRDRDGTDYYCIYDLEYLDRQSNQYHDPSIEVDRLRDEILGGL